MGAILGFVRLLRGSPSLAQPCRDERPKVVLQLAFVVFARHLLVHSGRYLAQGIVVGQQILRGKIQLGIFVPRMLPLGEGCESKIGLIFTGRKIALSSPGLKIQLGKQSLRQFFIHPPKVEQLIDIGQQAVV